MTNVIFRRHLNRYHALLLIVLLFATTALGQLPTGTILGVVKDHSDAVVPQAKVTAVNTATGQTRTAVTSDDGAYRLPALPVGKYMIRAERSGFKVEERNGITVEVSQETVINFNLDVGSATETVAVSAEEPLVNLTNSTLGGLVDEQKMADLPLNGRNYVNLTLLQPGITQHVSQSLPLFVGTSFSSSGAPIHSNTYLLDGANLTNVWGMSAASAANTTLGVEGIREYKVITNNFSADYGLTMGSLTLLVSKGGTNNFHGSAFEYIRNSALDARNYFDTAATAGSHPNGTPRRLPPFKRNNYGGSFGGPIQKDKTFFFITYEDLTQRLGQTIVSQVPGAGCHGAANTVITDTTCPQLGNTSSVVISPSIAPFLALYPTPNLPGTSNFAYGFNSSTDEHYGQVRVDRTFSASDSVFARYTIDDALVISGLPLPPFQDNQASRGQWATFSENHIFSPSLLNTARFSFSRSAQTYVSPPFLSGPQYTWIVNGPSPTIGISGFSSFGPDATFPYNTRQQIFTTSDDLFYEKGSHSLKFGTLIQRIQQDLFAESFASGNVSFGNLSGFLSGVTSALTTLAPGFNVLRHYRNSTFGFYAQDDWRTNSRLTLNLGLRYEFATVEQDRDGIQANLRNFATDVNPTIGPWYKNPSLKNFSPRLGFAWDIFGNGKTSLRGGFAYLYDIATLGSAMAMTPLGTPPFSTLVKAGALTVANPIPISANVPNNLKSSFGPIYDMKQPQMYQYNLTIERQLPGQMALSVSYSGSRGMHLMQFVDLNPTIPQRANGRLFWSPNQPLLNPNWGSRTTMASFGDSYYNALLISVTRRLSKGLELQNSYTWSKLIDNTQGQTGAESTETSATPITVIYNGIDRGLAAFDTRQNYRFNAIYHFPTGNLEGVAKSVLDGWWTSGILALQTGYPFSPVLGFNRSRSRTGGGGSGGDRPDVLPGRNNSNITHGITAGCPGVAAGQRLGTPQLYFDPCAYTLQQPGYSGSAGRDSLIGPGLANLDFSLVKDTPLKVLGEGGLVEFRAEVFNILNRPNFLAPPNRTVFSGNSPASACTPLAAGSLSCAPGTEAVVANAGVINSTSTTSRQIQVALKVLF